VTLELDEQIRVLIDHSATPVAASEVISAHEKSSSRLRGPLLQPRTRRIAFRSAGLLLTAAAIAIVGVSVGSANKRSVTPSAAPTPASEFPVSLSAPAQLRLLADRIADQDVQAVGEGQLLLTQSQLSVAAQVNNGQATATVNLAVKKWSDSNGLSCVSITTQPAQFVSTQDQAAWLGLGLLVTPSPQPITDCSGPGAADSPPDTITGSSQLINVADLPTDPLALAQQLQAGKTGIPAVDDMLPDLGNPDIAFQRAAVLLVGPTLGATPEFESALYRAIALLPGVASIGTTTTHSGLTGVGFAVSSPNGQSAIVVDPATGALIEIRNLEDSSALTSLAEHYVGNGPLQVTSYGAQLQWLDPVGQPQLVPQSDLPADVPVSIYAVAKSGDSQQMFALGQSLQQQFGGPSAGGSGSSEGATGPGSPGAMEWSFVSKDAQFNQYLAAIKASGLFSQIDVI
jgi:hypothetical protein